MKIAVILDKKEIEKWQLDSLISLNSQIKIELILNCNNSKNKRNYFKISLLCFQLSFF